jgi:hypothetical protein
MGMRAGLGGVVAVRRVRGPVPNPLRDALTVLTAAACAARQRLSFNEPLWTLIGLHTHGRLDLNRPIARPEMAGLAMLHVTVATNPSRCSSTTRCISGDSLTARHSRSTRRKRNRHPQIHCRRSLDAHTGQPVGQSLTGHKPLEDRHTDRSQPG